MTSETQKHNYTIQESNKCAPLKCDFRSDPIRSNVIARLLSETTLHNLLPSTKAVEHKLWRTNNTMALLLGSNCSHLSQATLDQQVTSRRWSIMSPLCERGGST